MMQGFDLPSVQVFMESGGTVLWVIMAATFVLWMLMIERWLYFKFEVKKNLGALVAAWNQRSEWSSWQAHAIRKAKISLFDQQVRKNLSAIKALVAVSPFLGLLGTVTGMITVFDVMAVTGTGNARMMASGISMATIPTMAGMVAALSGLFFGVKLESQAKRVKDSLADSLEIHCGGR